jgi:hypothetical protein
VSLTEKSTGDGEKSDLLLSINEETPDWFVYGIYIERALGDGH